MPSKEDKHIYYVLFSQTDKKSHVMHMHYLVMHTKIMPSVNTDFGNIEVNKIDMVPAITNLLHWLIK